MNFELDDYLFSFPDTSDPGFQSIISAKYEFKNLKDKKFFEQQVFVRRFMLQYDKLLVFHGTGTGKTCTSLAPAEKFLKDVLNNSLYFIYDYILPRKTYIDKIIIVVKNKDLIKEFEKQIFECTERILNYKMVEDVKSKYKFYTYNEFIRKIYPAEVEKQSLPNIELIAENNIKRFYNNKLIIIDEIHELLTKDSSKIRKDEDDEEIIEEDEDEKILGLIKYKRITNILHKVKYSKILLLTATPMTNLPKEIINIVNLILPFNNQMPQDFDFNLDVDKPEKYVERFKSYFSGFISYIRRKDANIKLIERGENLRDSTQKIYYNEFSDFQNKIYEKAYKKELDFKGNFKQESKEASNFVFPDGGYGKKSFTKYVDFVRNDEYSMKKELRDYIAKENGLRTLSAKYNDIIRINNDLKNQKCFCYIHQVKGSGAILLGLCLQEKGYSRFLSKKSAFIEKEEGNKIININKKPRYALIVSDTPIEKRKSILELFNSPENINGEYLKIIVGSKVTQIGLSLLETTIFINVSPEWSETRNYQAQSRIIRTNSHNTLLKMKKEELESKGIDPENAIIDVNIYKFAGYSKTVPSADEFIYYKVYQKDINIKRIERIMKIYSVDCNLFKNINYSENDINYSQICDYQMCNYPCYSKELDGTLINSYSVLYINELEERIYKFLFDKLKKENSISVNFLLDNFKEVPYKLIFKALQNIIENTERNYNFINFFGIEMSLKQEQNFIFLSKKNNNIFYDNYLIYIKEENAFTKDEVTKEKIFKDYEKTTNLIKFLTDNKDFDLYQILVEKVFNKKDKTKRDEELLDIFKNFFFKAYALPENIKNNEKLYVKKSKKGRNRISDFKRTVIDKLIDEKLDKEIQLNFIKTLEAVEGYNVTAKLSRPDSCRIYINNAWRDCTEIENLIYGFYFKERNYSILKNYIDKRENYLFFGIRFPLFQDYRIISKETLDNEITFGRKCGNKKEDVIDILWNINKEYKTDKIYSKIFMKEILDKSFINYKDFSENKIKFYFDWLINIKNIQILCSNLEQGFIDKNLMLNF